MLLWPSIPSHIKHLLLSLSLPCFHNFFIVWPAQDWFRDYCMNTGGKVFIWTIITDQCLYLQFPFPYQLLAANNALVGVGCCDRMLLGSVLCVRGARSRLCPEDTIPSHLVALTFFLLSLPGCKLNLEGFLCWNTLTKRKLWKNRLILAQGSRWDSLYQNLEGTGTGEQDYATREKAGHDQEARPSYKTSKSNQVKYFLQLWLLFSVSGRNFF